MPRRARPSRALPIRAVLRSYRSNRKEHRFRCPIHLSRDALPRHAVPSHAQRSQVVIAHQKTHQLWMGNLLVNQSPGVAARALFLS